MPPLLGDKEDYGLPRPPRYRVLVHDYWKEQSLAGDPGSLRKEPALKKEGGRQPR